MARDTIYDRDLDRVPANHQPLTPLLYLDRAAQVFPAQVAVIHGPLRRTYADLYARDPARFEKATTMLAQAASDLSVAEDRWLELEMQRTV